MARPPKPFWDYVSVGAIHECWEWRGARVRGYGISSFPFHAQAHRRAWELACGPIPKGMLVLHHCDNPGCVNPTHLFLGTHQDNYNDMVAKGRRVAAYHNKTACKYGHPLAGPNLKLERRGDHIVRRCWLCHTRSQSSGKRTSKRYQEVCAFIRDLDKLPGMTIVGSAPIIDKPRGKDE